MDKFKLGSVVVWSTPAGAVWGGKVVGYQRSLNDLEIDRELIVGKGSGPVHANKRWTEGSFCFIQIGRKLSLKCVPVEQLRLVPGEVLA